MFLAGGEVTTMAHLPWKFIFVVVGALMAGNILLRILGFGTSPDSSRVLAESLSWASSISSRGPIVAAAIHGASVILSAIAIPLAVVLALTRR